MKRLHFWLATGFFSGLSPIAPGTAGSLLTLVILWFLHLSFVSLLLLGLLCFFLGVWSSGEVAARMAQKDPQLIVIDEMAGMILALVAAPRSLVGYGLAFVLFRFFDIRKPFPVKLAEKAPSGWGIMLDDMAAGLYALLILLVLRWVHVL